MSYVSTTEDFEQVFVSLHHQSFYENCAKLCKSIMIGQHSRQKQLRKTFVNLRSIVEDASVFVRPEINNTSLKRTVYQYL